MGTALAKVIQIESPAPPAVVQELAPVVAAAKAFAVTDVDSHGLALERLRILRNGERAIADYFEPSRKAADLAKKEILSARDGLIAPLSEARSVYDRKAQQYEAEERRKAEERERELQAQARKQEEERKLLEAIEAEESGRSGEASAILEEPVLTPAVRVTPAVAKVEGVSSRTTWSAEVHDLLALVRFVAAHPEWIHLLEPSMPNLNRQAVSQREAMNLPGVRAISQTVTSARR